MRDESGDGRQVVFSFLQSFLMDEEKKEEENRGREEIPFIHRKSRRLKTFLRKLKVKVLSGESHNNNNNQLPSLFFLSSERRQKPSTFTCARDFFSFPLTFSFSSLHFTFFTEEIEQDMTLVYSKKTRENVRR